MLLGVGLALGFEYLDNTFKTPDDIKEHLGVPFLGMVPEVDVQGAAAGGRPQTPPQVIKNPNSAVADAYRVLRTNLIFTSAQTTGRVAVVTSANPGEGKTTTVANLAAALAHNGAKVLAIDADLRRPTLYQHFGVQKTPGLTDLIVGKSTASQAIQTTRIDGLQILPCGYQPPNPAELLGSPMMQQVLEALRSHYDWVLIDTPPILAMADTSVLARPRRGRRAGARGGEGDEALGRARDRPGARCRRQGDRRRPEQGQPGAQLLLLQPALRRVLPQLLRGEGLEVACRRGAGAQVRPPRERATHVKGGRG